MLMCMYACTRDMMEFESVVGFRHFLQIRNLMDF